MKTIWMILLVLMWTVPALAGKIYGTIRENGRPVGPGVVIQIIVEGKVAYETETDRNGTYRLYVREIGTFEIKIRDDNRYRDAVPPIPVHSYQKAVRFNLVIVREEDRFVLRRD